jgi:chromosomal replication initiation ATPase DnaA
LPAEYLNNPTLFQRMDSYNVDTDIDAQTLMLQAILQDANWITNQIDKDLHARLPSTSTETKYPFHFLTLWKEEIKTQESILAQCRRTRADPSNQVTIGSPCIDTAMYAQVKDYFSEAGSIQETKAFHIEGSVESTMPQSFDVRVAQVAKEFQLNVKQQYAFIIVAKRFGEILQENVAKHPSTIRHNGPLRMFMTGPGGTGKTHVVKALKKLMKSYGYAHQIRFLAPTGTAAALIDGQTVHSALGIPVHMNKAEK